LKVLWTDSYRTISANGGGGCGWDLRIDGTSCVPNPLLHVQHSWNAGVSLVPDTHQASTVVGVCEDVGIGSHTIQVYQKRRDGDEDCYRGHGISLMATGNADRYGATIIVEEIE
jgi:hypothetical protein